MSAALIAATMVVGTSLLIVGGHYPTDVLGRFLLGVAWMAPLLALGTTRTERQRNTGTREMLAETIRRFRRADPR